MYTVEDFGPDVEILGLEQFDCKTPGFYKGVPDWVYFKCPAISNSTLGYLADECPAVARHLMLNPTPPKDHHKVGSGIHAAVLEPGLFDLNWAFLPDEVNLRTKVGKEERQRLYDQYGEEFVVREQEMELVKNCANSIITHPTAGPLLRRPSYRELTMLFNWKGRLCKGKADSLIWTHPETLIDIKSTKQTNPSYFLNDAERYGYHRQAAMYWLGATILGLPVKEYKIVSVCKEPPYLTYVINVTEATRDRGLAELSQLMDTYISCDEADHWPAPSDEEMEFAIN